MLELLRWGALGSWGILFVVLIGSATRRRLGQGTERDATWGVAWLFSALQFAWGIRNVSLAPPLVGSAYTTTCGLHVFGMLVALIIFYRRWQYEGLRW